MANWKEMIEKTREHVGDNSDVVKYLPVDLDFEEEFDDGYGLPEGTPFILWTEKFVYFPVVYDGAEWVEAVPRNPTNDWVPGHIGGH